MKLLQRVLLVIAPVMMLQGCLYYVFPDHCPAYTPAHDLTDGVMADINAGKPLWDGMDYPAGWHHSAWVERRLPVCRPTDASVRAFGVHYRADGSEISRFERSYRVQLKDGQWQVLPVRPNPPTSSSQQN